MEWWLEMIRLMRTSVKVMGGQATGSGSGSEGVGSKVKWALWLEDENGSGGPANIR